MRVRILVRCVVVGEWDRWGHTCGSLKYLFFFFTHELSWGFTKGVGLALMAEEKRKEKKKKRKKEKGNGLGWVGCGARCQ